MIVTDMTSYQVPVVHRINMLSYQITLTNRVVYRLTADGYLRMQGKQLLEYRIHAM